MVEPRVVVLIPTLNEADHIAAVLDDLIGTDPYVERCRVIVADGGSMDATCSIVREKMKVYANLYLLNNRGRTQAAAMNMLLGADFSDADIAVRCDAHAFYPANFVRNTVKELEAHNAASVVVTMDAVEGEDAGCFRRGLAMVADSLLGAGGAPHRGGAASGFVDHGHHAAFRLDAFRALQGYDRSFVANEDAEYDRRLTEAGHKIWLDANIRIGYVPRDSPAGLWRQYYRYGYGRAGTCLKHQVRPSARQLIPFFHVLLTLVSILILPLSGLGVLWPLTYGALVITAAVLIAWRNRALCGLVAAPALAIMHTAWGIGFGIGLVKGVSAERTGITP